jgi:hypothetical protein
MRMTDNPQEEVAAERLPFMRRRQLTEVKMAGSKLKRNTKAYKVL